MIKYIIAIAIYFASVFLFYFIANIVCSLADWDTDYIIIYSFVWPGTLVVMALLLFFFMVEIASDHVSDKIEDFMYKREQKKNGKDNGESSPYIRWK